MRAGIWAIAIAAIVMVASLTGQHADASPSSGLSSVLSQIRFMGNIDFDSLVNWAKHDAPTPGSATFQPEKAEVDINNLGGSDRDAVLNWLRGNGRGALHNQGASDSEIGPLRGTIDAASATPNPWRSIPLATATLDQAPQSGIQVLGGFAAVKKDGTGAMICLSFKNVDPRVANHVVVEFPILADGGQETGKLVLDRSGQFSPNIDIRSYESLAAWQSGAGPHSQADGCIGKTLPTAAIPFLQARAAGYRTRARPDLAPFPDSLEADATRARDGQREGLAIGSATEYSGGPSTRAHNSAVECLLHTEEVAGSIPAAPTNRTKFGLRAKRSRGPTPLLSRKGRKTPRPRRDKTPQRGGSGPCGARARDVRRHGTRPDGIRRASMRAIRGDGSEGLIRQFDGWDSAHGHGCGAPSLRRRRRSHRHHGPRGTHRGLERRG